MFLLLAWSALCAYLGRADTVGMSINELSSKVTELMNVPIATETVQIFECQSNPKSLEYMGCDIPAENQVERRQCRVMNLVSEGPSFQQRTEGGDCRIFDRNGELIIGVQSFKIGKEITKLTCVVNCFSTMRPDSVVLESAPLQI